MEYRIVPMSLSHLDALVTIEKECFSNPWTREGLEEEIGNPLSHFLVAVTDSPVGYIGVQEISSQAYVTNVAVLPAFRRQGIGKALVTAAISGAKSRECEFITLEVRQSNTVAISLYESLGFKTAGLRKGFYTNPAEDALIYTLSFE